MNRYVTRAYIADDCVFDDHQTAPTMGVIDGDDARDTGLFDAAGERIFRMREPAGFVKRHDT